MLFSNDAIETEKIERTPTLPEEPDSNKCEDDTETIVIKIPCRLAKRVQRYADENGNTITGVIIEALDALLGGRTEGPFWESSIKNPTVLK